MLQGYQKILEVLILIMADIFSYVRIVRNHTKLCYVRSQLRKEYLAQTVRLSSTFVFAEDLAQSRQGTDIRKIFYILLENRYPPSRPSYPRSTFLDFPPETSPPREKPRDHKKLPPEVGTYMCRIT
jgi:hypothetical protein